MHGVGSVGGCAQEEEEVDAVVHLTTNSSLATGSEAVSRTAAATLTDQHDPSADSVSTSCDRLSAISTWWTACAEQAIIFASAHHRAAEEDGGRAIETHLAALLTEFVVDTARQNVYDRSCTQLQRKGINTAHLVPQRNNDALPTLESSETSDDGGEEATRSLSRGASSDEPAAGATWSCPSRCSVVREFVDGVLRDGLLEAVPVAAAIAATQCPTVSVITTEGKEKTPFYDGVSATTPEADGISRPPPEEGQGEEQHQQQQHAEPCRKHDGRARGTRFSDVVRRVSSSAPGVVMATRAPSPTPATDTSGGGTDATHPSGLHFVRLTTSLPQDGCSQTRSATPVAGITVEQRVHSSAAAKSAGTTDSLGGRRCTPPSSSRKRFRNGTFVRITNIPVKIAAVERAVKQLDAAIQDRRSEARADERCWRPRLTPQQSSQRQEAPAAAALRPRPRTVLQQGVVGVGSGRVSPVASRPPDVTVKRETKSAGVVRSAAGVGVEARNVSRGGARVQLRGNRWCSPSVVGDGVSTSLDLEGSVTSLLTVPSCGGGGGGGSSRDKLPFPTAPPRDIRQVLIVGAAAPHRPPPRGQALYIFDPYEKAAIGTAATSSGVADGGDESSETTRTIYGVAVGGEEGGEQKQGASAGCDEEIDLCSIKSSERVFPPMSYQYKSHVQESWPQGRTELSAAAAGVTAAATAAVAAATAAAERSEREASFWRNCSNIMRAEGGTQSGASSIVPAEYEMQGIGEVDGASLGSWKVAPPPKLPIGRNKQVPLANSRPGRSLTVRP